MIYNLYVSLFWYGVILLNPYPVFLSSLKWSDFRYWIKFFRLKTNYVFRWCDLTQYIAFYWDLVENACIWLLLLANTSFLIFRSLDIQRLVELECIKYFYLCNRDKDWKIILNKVFFRGDMSIVFFFNLT